MSRIQRCDREERKGAGHSTEVWGAEATHLFAQAMEQKRLERLNL